MKQFEETIMKKNQIMFSVAVLIIASSVIFMVLQTKGEIDVGVDKGEQSSQVSRFGYREFNLDFVRDVAEESSDDRLDSMIMSKLRGELSRILKTSTMGEIGMDVNNGKKTPLVTAVVSEKGEFNLDFVHDVAEQNSDGHLEPMTVSKLTEKLSKITKKSTVKDFIALFGKAPKNILESNIYLYQYYCNGMIVRITGNPIDHIAVENGDNIIQVLIPDE
jgi:hypothetical protein